jgi:hypothetical protein
MNVSEMVAAGLEYYRNGLMPDEAAQKAFVEDDFDSVRFLAVTGLAHKIGDAAKGFRAIGPDVEDEIDVHVGSSRSGRFQHRTQPSEAAAAYYWLAKPYGTADQRTASILDFTPDDAAHNLQVALPRLAGWSARVELWQALADGFSSHPKARTTRELPKVLLGRLDGLAQAAFSGRAVAV